MARNFQGAYVVSIPVGTTLKIEVPLDLRTGAGCFPLKDATVKINNVDSPVVLGFALEDAAVGTLDKAPEADSEKRLMVRYTHNQPKTNKIYFYSATGEIQTISIIAIPVHDHASVTQGGPALGTYYTIPTTTP